MELLVDSANEHAFMAVPVEEYARSRERIRDGNNILVQESHRGTEFFDSYRIGRNLNGTETTVIVNAKLAARNQPFNEHFNMPYDEVVIRIANDVTSRRKRVFNRLF